MTHRPIYLDYMATTPVDPRVAKKMSEYLLQDGKFGNPASQNHIYGWEAAEAIELARHQVADAVHADPREIIWTSGATESINLALKGAAHFYQRQGKHIIITNIAHKATLETCQFLVKEGFELTILKVAPSGLLDPDVLKKALRKDTILVSIIHINNEIGVIQDIATLGKITRNNGALLHVDAAQSVGKVPLNLTALNVDLMSFSAHKSYGPKGVGALYVRRTPRVRLQPLIHGGGHQWGLRAGTLPTHQIVGMGEAFFIAEHEFELHQAHIQALHKKLWAGIQTLPDIYLNGDATARVPHNINVSFGGVDGEALLLALKDLAVSSGSACTTATIEPSHVLRAIGQTDLLAHATLRFCIGRTTTEEEIDNTINLLEKTLPQIRKR